VVAPLHIIFRVEEEDVRERVPHRPRQPIVVRVRYVIAPAVFYVRNSYQYVVFLYTITFYSI
jgi:hypothetical protein